MHIVIYYIRTKKKNSALLSVKKKPTPFCAKDSFHFVFQTELCIISSVLLLDLSLSVTHSMFKTT